MTPEYPIKMPFGITTDRLDLEAGAFRATNRTELEWLAKEADMTDEELFSILRGAVILKTHLPESTMAECLYTAIIWSRG